MKPNVGKLDRGVRAIGGILLIVAFALDVFSGIAGIVSLIVGIVLLGTVVFRFCPPYALLGINTCGGGEKTES